MEMQEAAAGEVTMLLFHCVFKDGASISHSVYEADEDIYQVLDRTYAICVADNSVHPRGIPAGYFIRTSRLDLYRDFDEEMYAAARFLFGAEQLKAWEATLHPARHTDRESGCPTEPEMLQIMVSQRLKLIGAWHA